MALLDGGGNGGNPGIVCRICDCRGCLGGNLRTRPGPTSTIARRNESARRDQNGQTGEIAAFDAVRRRAMLLWYGTPDQKNLTVRSARLAHFVLRLAAQLRKQHC